MDLIQWLVDRWQSESIHNTYIWIPDGNVQMQPGGALTPTPVKAGEQYYQIWLSEMFLRYQREWGSSWYPTVMVSIQLKFGNKSQEITHVAGESTLKDFKKSDASCVALNHPITTILPFNGGSIEMEAALLSMQGKDNVQSLIKVLGSFSKLLVVPQLSVALAVAKPLAEGVAELLGVTKARPELRMHEAWGGAEAVNSNILRRGYFAVISAEDGEIPAAELFVREHRLYRNDLAMEGYDYMLFRVDVGSTRDDWDSITSISGPYEEAIGMLENSLKADDPALQKGMQAEAEKRLNAARFATYRAPELTNLVGRNQVLDALDRRWKDAKRQLAGLGAVAVDVPRRLSEAMRNPLAAAKAIELGEPREEDAWS
jgi:hypothetical protein